MPSFEDSRSAIDFVAETHWTETLRTQVNCQIRQSALENGDLQ